MNEDATALANARVKRARTRSIDAFRAGRRAEGLRFAQDAEKAGDDANHFWRAEGQLCHARALAQTVTIAPDQTQRQKAARDKALEAVGMYRASMSDPRESTTAREAARGEVEALATYATSCAYLYSKRGASAEHFDGLVAAIEMLDANPIIKHYVDATIKHYTDATVSRANLRGGPLGEDGGAIRDLLGAYAFTLASRSHGRPRKSDLDRAIIIGEAAIEIGTDWSQRQQGDARSSADRKLDELVKNQVSRFTERYSWYGAASDFRAMLALTPELDVLLADRTRTSLQLQRKLMTSYWRHWVRAQDPASLAKARQLASQLSNILPEMDEERWEAADMLAGIHREQGALPESIRVLRSAVESYRGDRNEPRHLMRRARLLSDSIANDPRSPNAEAWFGELQLLTEQALANNNVGADRWREHAVLLASACLRTRSHGNEAGPIIDRAIANARREQAHAAGPDRLAAARFYRGLASLAGFAYVRAGEHERAYRSIEASISSILKAADPSDTPAEDEDPTIPEEHRFGYVGVTPFGAFVLRWDGKRWEGQVVEGLTEKALVQTLRARPDRPGDGPLLSPRLSSGQRPSDHIGPLWLAAVRKLAESSGLSDALHAHFGTASSASIVPLGVMRSMPLHALTKDGAAVFPRMPSYSLTAFAPNRAFADGTRVEVALANPCPIAGELPANAYFTESIGGAEAARWEAATAEAMRSRGRGARVLRIGCHAKFHPETPMASALELADGDFGVADLLALDFTGTKLAIMTCCESAVADTRVHTDEGIGLTGALLHGGATHVISGLWKVHALVATLIDHHTSAFIAEGMEIQPAFSAALSKLQNLDPLGWEDEIGALRDRIRKLEPLDSPKARTRWQGSLDALADISMELGTRKTRIPIAATHPDYFAPFILTHLGPAPPEETT